MPTWWEPHSWYLERWKYTQGQDLLGLRLAQQWLHDSRCLGSLTLAAIPVLWQAGFALSLSLFKHPMFQMEQHSTRVQFPHLHKELRMVQFLDLHKFGMVMAESATSRSSFSSGLYMMQNKPWCSADPALVWEAESDLCMKPFANRKQIGSQ